MNPTTTPNLTNVLAMCDSPGGRVLAGMIVSAERSN